MKAALYHPWVYLTSGAERTLLELVRRSRHDWTIFTHHFSPSTTYDELSEIRVETLSPPVSVRRSLGPLLKATYAVSQAELPKDAGEALLVSSEGLGDFIVNRAKMPAACYCHTPLKILHDPETRAALKEIAPSKHAMLRTLGPMFSAADRRMWRRYEHVFANSLETRARIASAGLAEEDRVEVLRPGVDSSRFVISGVQRRRNLFLVAGRIMWQKNIELAIDALAEARSRGSDIELVVAGAVDEKSRPYLEQLRARAAGLPVTFEADPTDDRLTELYLSATAVVFTARNEDLGIVPLEAMAAGAPVIAVDRGGPRETIVNNVTGWLLAPEAHLFAEQMRTVSVAAEPDLAVLRRAATERAAAFGWDAFVQRVDDVMEQLAAREPVTEPVSPVLAGVTRTAMVPAQPSLAGSRLSR
jgi:glycosyltransferase involved in cell wall biosynthesis